MFENYFKTAFRNLSRNKVYSFINIAGLSLGLACAMLIMLYVKDEVSFDRFHQNIDNIYRIASKTSRQKMGWTGVLQGPRFTQKCSWHKIICACARWARRYKKRNRCAITIFVEC